MCLDCKHNTLSTCRYATPAAGIGAHGGCDGGGGKGGGEGGGGDGGGDGQLFIIGQPIHAAAPPVEDRVFQPALPHPATMGFMALFMYHPGLFATPP